MPRKAVAFAVLLLLAGCGGQDVKVVSETRTTTLPPQASLQTVPQSPAPSAVSVAGPSAASRYRWQVPEGWSETPAPPMRMANFSITSNPDVECYVTVLGGPAGGIDANINRWRGQMGQPELTAAEIAALPTVEIMGRPAPVAEIAGTYTGMGDRQSPDYLLLGAVAALADHALFVKMTGPAAAVQAEKDRFLAFCRSITGEEAGADAAAQESK